MTAQKARNSSGTAQELDLERARAVQALGSGVRTSLRDNATAYGFSVTITAAFGLVSAAHPAGMRPLPIMLFAAGAALAFFLVELVASHLFKRIGGREGEKVVLISGAVDVLSIGAAAGSAVLLAKTPGMLAWPLTSFGTTLIYLLMGGLDILIARQLARRS